MCILPSRSNFTTVADFGRHCSGFMGALLTKEGPTFIFAGPSVWQIFYNPMTLSNHPRDSLLQRLLTPTLAQSNQEDEIHHGSTDAKRIFSPGAVVNRCGNDFVQQSRAGPVHADQPGHHHKRSQLEKWLGSRL